MPDTPLVSSETPRSSSLYQPETEDDDFEAEKVEDSDISEDIKNEVEEDIDEDISTD